MPQALDAKAPQILPLDARGPQILVLDAIAPQVLALAGVILATSEETVSHLIEMVRNDTRPTLEFTVKDANGVAINITGSTPRFRIRRRLATAVLINRVCTITDGPGGKCQFTWAATDWLAGAIDAAGRYEGELEVTFSDLTVASVFDVYEIVARDQVG